MPDRRAFLALCASAGLTSTFAEAVWNQLDAAEVLAPGETLPYRRLRVPVTTAAIRAAESIVGVSYSEAERELMIGVLESYLKSFEAIRTVPMTNSTAPAFQFSAILPGRMYRGSTRPADVPPSSRPTVQRPQTDAELAFLTVVQLGELIRTRQVSSTELTKLYIGRLRRYDPTLHCAITVTEDRALRQAAAADREIAAGRYRGPLHGMPYGVKDTMSVAGYPTTWGVAAYRKRVLPSTATVVQKLDSAGAVLIAKLSMGELGLNDRWFGGQTMNPWQPTQGALGSSSGSAAATAAGLVAFALGQETLGSIVVPAAASGITGLRPTFGRVSRTGSMTLCWTLDKIGPMARGAEDCAIVLEAINGRGAASLDMAVEPIPFAWNPARSVSGIRVGFHEPGFNLPHPDLPHETAVLQRLDALGIPLRAVALPKDLPVNAALFVRVEAVAALDEITRADGLKLLEEQHEQAWPNFIRSGRFVPAFEYIQANRLRTILMEQMEKAFEHVDVIVAPTRTTINLTNLTGHPCLVAPCGMSSSGTPASISFIGKPFGEAELCAVAHAWQRATVWHNMHPLQFND